ncbi:growth-regulating factor 1 [Tanacetum coccineum]
MITHSTTSISSNSLLEKVVEVIDTRIYIREELELPDDTYKEDGVTLFRIQGSGNLWLHCLQMVLTVTYRMPNMQSKLQKEGSESEAFWEIVDGKSEYPSQKIAKDIKIGWNLFQMGYGKKIDSEPGRCRRTDGKKWRCSKPVHPEGKYCERHMHRGRNRSRKPVELANTNSSSSSSSRQRQQQSNVVSSHDHCFLLESSPYSEKDYRLRTLENICIMHGKLKLKMDNVW